MSASQAVFEAAGRPTDDAWAGDTRGACRLCGADGVGRPFDAWVRDTFTDHDLLRPGSIICTACLFCAQERTDWLAQRTGKEKGQRMRSYSHFVAGGVWYVLSKADKPAMRELLIAEPEVAVIADSGQKHLIFRARPGVWQFELIPIPADPESLSRLLLPCDRLYAAGATKAEILSGRYSAGSILRIGLADWRELDRELRPHRGSPMLELAVFLTLKPEAELARDDEIRVYQPADPGGQYALL